MKRQPGARWVHTSWARVLLVAGAAVVMLSCSSPNQATRKSTSLVDGAQLVPPREPRQIWRYHPRDAGDVLSVRDVSDTERLFTSARGERWLVGGGARQIQIADTLAPEGLVASSKERDGWVFVGLSGTTYEASTPLGVFARATPPPQSLRRVTAAKGHLLGIGYDGRLLHSGDTGKSWRPVGPPERFIDVQLTNSLVALALAVPEQLHVSEDGGQTWRVLPEPPRGASALSRAEPLEVRTAFGALHYDVQEAALELPHPRRSSSGASLPPVNPTGPSALALRDSRASVWRNRYYEVLESGGNWDLLFGEVGFELERRTIPQLSGCAWTRLAAGASSIVVACGRKEAREGRSVPIDFVFSADAGRTWARAAANIFGQAASLRLAVTGGARLFVSGVCARESSEPGCLPSGVFSVTLEKAPDPTSVAFEPVSLPALRGTALSLVPSASGESVYVVGRRTKNHNLAVYIPIRTTQWEPRELSDLTTDLRDDVRVTANAQAADGTLALVLTPTADEQPVLVLIDQGARLLSVASAPAPHTAMAGYGSFAFAADPLGRETWESVNGGVTWQPRGTLPLSICEKNQPCDFALSCSDEGCVVGDLLSRYGWREHAVLGEQAPLEEAHDRFLERKVGVPIVCDVSDAEWTSLGSLTSLPGAEQAKLGTAVWFALRHNFDDASVSVIEATGGSLNLKETVLLPPTADPQKHAVFATVQVEGGAALRFQLPGAGQTARSAEVAWLNLLDPMVGHGRVPTPEPLGPQDTRPTPYAARLAQPDLVSVAKGGVYVKPYAARLGQPLYFLDGRSARLIQSPAWPEVMPTGRDEMLRVDGRDLFVRFLSDGAGMLRAVRQANDWEFAAMSVALYDPAFWGVNQVIDLTYSNGTPALQVITGGYNTAQSHGAVYPLQAQGAVFGAGVRVPTQLDVPDAAPPCTPEQVRATPRVVAPFLPGSRHPVVISAGIEPLRVLATEGAVLHGTVEHPCLRALDGRLPKRTVQGVQEEERVLIDRDDMTRSWLFRVAREERVVVQYRKMSCQMDAGMRVPEEVFSLPGTVVRTDASSRGAPTKRERHDQEQDLEEVPGP